MILQTCRSESHAAVYLSRQRRLATSCFGRIWIRRQEGEACPVNRVSLSISACSPAMCTIGILILSTSTRSCILLSSQLEAKNHNTSLGGLHNQASTLERNDRLITASACLHTLWSSLLVHLQRPDLLRMITLVNSNVFYAMSAEELPDEQRLCNLVLVTCIRRSFHAETDLLTCLLN